MTDNETGDIRQAQQMLLKLAHVAQAIEARNADALRRIEAGTGAMEQGVQRLDGSVERFIQDAMQAISRGSQAAVGQGAQQALAQFNHQLQQSAGDARSAADALREQGQAARHAQRALVWKSLVALAVGSVLAAGGSAYVAWNSLREVRQAEFSTAILRATQSGMLTACGKEQALCVRVGDKPRRAGAHGEYVMVE